VRRREAGGRKWGGGPRSEEPAAHNPCAERVWCIASVDWRVDVGSTDAGHNTGWAFERDHGAVERASGEGWFVKMWRYTCMLGAVVIALAVAGSGSAFAANHPNAPARAQSKAQWQHEIANLRTPGKGCYHASYPALQWHATACLVAPAVPLAPRLSGGPRTVGDGKDYAAKVSGTISKATGTFNDVSSSLTEKGQINDTGPQVKNAFSLQLNSQFFSDTPACDGAAVPADCLGWQQFVYAFHYSGTTNEVFMQYWLLYYDTTCPTGWMTDETDGYIFCYANSPATSYGSLPATRRPSRAASAGHRAPPTVTASSTLRRYGTRPSGTSSAMPAEVRRTSERIRRSSHKRRL